MLYFNLFNEDYLRILLKPIPSVILNILTFLCAFNLLVLYYNMEFIFHPYSNLVTNTLIFASPLPPDSYRDQRRGRLSIINF